MKKRIIFYATDQSAHVEGEPQMRNEDGWPWAKGECIEWCKTHGYDYEIVEY